MKLDKEVYDTWKRILAEGGSRQRSFSMGNELKLFYGSDTLGRPILVLVSKEELQVPEFSNLVEVTHGKRKDGFWTVILAVKSQQFNDIFITLCIDLAAAAGEQPSEELAVKTFYKTLVQWKLLFKVSKKRLNLEKLRGLVAELAFMRQLLVAGRDPGSVIDAWIGPLRAPNDFRFSSEEVYEIKSTRSGGRTIGISSVEQLDNGTVDEILLVVVTLNDKASREGKELFSPVELVHSLRTFFETDSSSSHSFRTKLEILGFDETDPYYNSMFFEVLDFAFYSVRDNFPRILLASVPGGVIGTKYKLILSSLFDFFSHNELPHELNVKE